MSRAVPFIQRILIESWQRRQFEYTVCGSDGRIIIECSMNPLWSDVAILAFTFCSKVLFVSNMAEKQS